MSQLLSLCSATSENESRSVVSDSLRHNRLYSPWNSPGQNTRVGSLSLLQGIFPTQRSNPGLLHCRWILYPLSHKRSPSGIIVGGKSTLKYIEFLQIYSNFSIRSQLININLECTLESINPSFYGWDSVLTWYASSDRINQWHNQNFDPKLL